MTPRYGIVRFAVIAFAALVGFSPVRAEPASARPNVLFIAVDDLRPELGCYGQYPRGKVMGHSMRTDRYRLTLWVRDNNLDEVVAVELYDHGTDPGENTNVAGDPANAALVEKLTAKLRAGWRGALPPTSSR